MRYLLYGGKTVTGKAVEDAVILIEGERLGRIFHTSGDDESRRLAESFMKSDRQTRLIDLKGRLVFAGGIDAHVHFREPGMTQKADIATESLAALRGGVTSFMDMPNTRPATTSAARLKEKIEAATGRSWANFGFHIGATNDNCQEIMEILTTGKDGVTSRDVAGIQVFMGSSTGNMLVDDDSTLDSIFRLTGKEVLVHCEDEATVRRNTEAATRRYGEDIPFRAHMDIRSREACILSSGKALQTAVKYGTRLHLLHISTREELQMVKEAREAGGRISAETSANYLWFSDRDYDRLGSRVKCNPSIKTEDDRAALREALKNGLIDTVGSDHAPHLASEKDRKYLAAPSGLPSVQQTLQVLLTVAAEEDIPLTRIASVFSERASELFGIRDRGRLQEGFFADLVIVDPDAEEKIEADGLACKCGWSPYEGETLKGKITDVFINGRHVIDGSAVTVSEPSGKRLVFEK